ncbi:MAG TPA: ATP synthase F1 subunit gamma [Pseudomonadota bacterium]|jgi:F-type H+-transporting ATPase subunit gamma|nr:ATP synthase F1 subunit gamma [Pseudomonadota bacterium]HNI60799.1 ATP synthase F1 subunit gamma [Pseudomonadota bacterium]HNN49513.1 ATP synthase F1 subunit gamma [Pseudomonadota bacterium]
MPSLKSIRKRIASVKNTQKITKAMKMVATAKLRRAQDAVKAIRPYASHLSDIADELAARLLAEPQGTEPSGQAQDDAGPTLDLLHRILVGGTDKRVRLVVVSADRGLAGAYNSSIFRRVERFATEIKLQEGHSLDLVVIGKKGRDYFRRRPHKVAAEHLGVDPKSAASRARELSSQLTDALVSDEVDAIYVLYNEFKSAASQVVRLERLLPLKVRESVRKKDGEEDDEPKQLIDFLYEPSREAVLRHLLPLFLETELCRIFLEAIASEMGARMSAMDNASRNAKEMIGRLTLQYNRARQAAITKELMEIVGGAEALKG